MKSVIIIILFLIGPTLTGQVQDFGLEEKGGEYLPDSIYVLNEDSVPIDLNLLITKPTLLSLVYYRCPALCPKTLAGIAELINYSDAVPGEDYQVITLSINHRESSAEARAEKTKYTREVQRSIDPYFWRFFTADSITIRRITDAIGWNFRESGEDFVHTASSVLITPGKMVSQYFYGTYFNYMHFAMAVEQAEKEVVAPTRLKTLKYCYNYKPEENTSLLMIFRVFGIVLILIVAGFFIFLAYRVPGKKSSNE
jgi:protein SCO1/2